MPTEEEIARAHHSLFEFMRAKRLRLSQVTDSMLVSLADEQKLPTDAFNVAATRLRHGVRTASPKSQSSASPIALQTPVQFNTLAEAKALEFEKLADECDEIQEQPLHPYPVSAWEGTPYLEFSRTARGEGTERPNYIPHEFLINGLMTFVGAVCGHRIMPGFNPAVKARFITIMLSEVGGIGKDTVQGWLMDLFHGTQLIRLKGMPRYRNIGCFKGDFASERAMIQAQTEHPITLQFYGEFTTATEKMGIQGSGQSFINLLLHYADSDEPRWSAVKDQRIPENAPEKVEVSLLGFSTKSRWDKVTLDFETFLQRVNVIFSRESRTVSRLVTPDFSALRETLLQRILLLETHTFEWDFTPEAGEVFDKWFQDLRSNRIEDEDNRNEVIGRIQVYLLRLLGHLAFWTAPLPETAKGMVVKKFDDGTYQACLTADAGLSEGTSIGRRNLIWKAEVNADLVNRAIQVAEYELDMRARCVPPRGSIIAAHAENTVRRWTKEYGKIQLGRLLRDSHLQERFGVKISLQAVLSVAEVGDIHITKNPEDEKRVKDWILTWKGASGMQARELRGWKSGRPRTGAGRFSRE